MCIGHEDYPRPFLIGLTGGIGCGKTLVTDSFARLGVPIIDADLVSRQLVEPGQAALELIIKRFGCNMLLPDGNLNRQLLRDIVFKDESARADLEKIVHPRIRTRMNELAQAIAAPYVILAIPLLFEKSYEQMVDRILVIDCSLEQQIERTSARDGVTQEQVRSIIDTQVSRSYRVAAADDLIDNSGSFEQLIPQIEALHKKYLAILAKD